MIEPAKRLSTVKEYYFSRKLKEISDLRQKGKDVLNLGIGNPDLPPSQQTLNALHTNSAHADKHGYQSYSGNPDLRKAFVKWYATHFQVDLHPDKETLPLIGSKEGIMHISMAFVNPGEGVLIPDPGYPAYKSVAELVGAKVYIYNLKEENGWLPDFDELEKMDLKNIKLMWINYPNMPTGTKANIKELEKIINFGIKHKILIVNDNPYSFILNNHPVSIFNIPQAKQIALELNSLSKSHNMAGWRIGVVVGNEQYIRNILKVKSNVDSGMFLPLQLAAVEALNSPKSWYDDLNAEYAKRRKVAEEIMDILHCTFDKSQSGMFLWAKVPHGYNNSYEFTDELLYKYDLFITPGGIFGKNGEQFIRISLAGNFNNLKIALNRLKVNVLENSRI
ncbi:MAG: aminotransferase class I/II-fold pyridoxal phosphate-dependent enzyme [Bacteroidales bacterium]|nr:aminotransferase class I/II-fold pyridoxal phosphate-dependent enzyme [Bacteroidales bacterium]